MHGVVGVIHTYLGVAQLGRDVKVLPSRLPGWPYTVDTYAVTWAWYEKRNKPGGTNAVRSWFPFADSPKAAFRAAGTGEEVKPRGSKLSGLRDDDVYYVYDEVLSHGRLGGFVILLFLFL